MEQTAKYWIRTAAAHAYTNEPVTGAAEMAEKELQQKASFE